MSSELAALDNRTRLDQESRHEHKTGNYVYREQGDGAPEKEVINTEVYKAIPKDSIQRSESLSPFSPFTMDFKLNVPWIILVSAAFATRMWQLTVPRHVVFDEVHFGRFTSLFMQQKFFFDVHPPLGKLLLAIAGYLCGFDGSFMFDNIGSDLGDFEYYVWWLRFVSALFGSLVVPCVYEIIIELGCSHWAASLGALMALLENMTIVQSRFILIDGALLFFTIFSVLSYLKFRRQANSPFSTSWWFWLLCTGATLMAVISVKYTGILTVILVLGLTCIDLWRIIGDKTVSDTQLSKHFISRGACLIANPVIMYLVQFYIMFALLANSGPHDDMMSSAFQASLKGGLTKITHGQPDEVAYGSQITLRNTFGRQCWLHSHAHTYPVKYPDGRGSSAQQQVTCYSFKDVNNWWIIKDPKRDELTVSFPPRPVMNGDIVQLVHGLTGRALNSHDVAAPLSPTNQEVSCYIDYNISMAAQNLWRVEILNADSSNVWKTIHSQVRFIHINTSQAVKTTGAQLPDWGFKQFEVVTDRLVNQQDTIWNVEEHQQNISYPDGTTKMKTEANKPKEPPSEVPVKPMPFFSKFWELQFKMLQSNKDLNQEHTFSSRPSQWPFMRRGVAYWIDSSRNMQIFCIGNPVVWWVGTVSIPVYLVMLLIYLMRRRRGIKDLEEVAWKQFTSVGYVLVAGYFIHFLPYFPMERTLFIHHYLPALLFKILLLPFLAEHIHSFVFRHRYLRYLVITCSVLLAVLVFGTFHYFSPFTYGHVELSSVEINRRKWLKTWDMLAHPNT